MVSMRNALQCVLLVLTFSEVCSRALSARSDSSRKIRHASGQREALADNAFSDINVLARLQSDILDNLGMSELPTASNQQQVPDYARQLAVEQFTNNQPEEHFMEKSSNLLLIAKKVHTEGFGETIQFIVNAEDRESRMSEVKLYYYINSSNISMVPIGSSDKLRLRLSLLKENGNGRTVLQLIENIEVHRHLIGWHSHKIPSNLITDILNDETTSPTSNITINFHLTCLNCNYQAFPSTITKENVPFLKVNSRRRRTRRNGLNQCEDGGCCPRELIVDFQAMGWDWVLYPKRYTANYCAGTCTNSPSSRATMSSQSHIINAMLSYIRSGRTSSCCIPSSEEFVENFTYVDRTGNIRTSSTTIRTIHSCRCT